MREVHYRATADRLMQLARPRYGVKRLRLWTRIEPIMLHRSDGSGQ